MMGAMSDYNYADFDLERETPPFDVFKTRLHVGERVESFSLEPLVGDGLVELSSLWKRGPAILEFGSFT